MLPVESYPEERLVYLSMKSVEAKGSSLRAVLKGLNLMEYADLLESEDLDLEVLGDEVNEDQLERIGVKTLGQRIRIIRAAKDARARSDGKGKEHSTEQTVGSQEKATVMIAQSGADEGGKKDSEADLERKRLEEKFETFMKNQKASSGGGGFSKRGVKFEVGQRVEFKVVNMDIAKGRIALELVKLL